MISLGQAGPVGVVRVGHRDGGISVLGPERGFHGYRQGQDGFGVFVTWEARDGSFILENDRFGFFPLFYCRTRDGFAFSSSLDELLPLLGDLELDEAALSLFVRLGHFLGDSTAFLGIKALPPGARLSMAGGEVSLEVRPHALPKERRYPVERAEVLFGELLEQAVERLTTAAGEPIVPLSGGRDSRHILLSMLARGRNPAGCVTVRYHPTIGGNEVLVAEQICARCGLDHSVLDPPSSWLDAEIRKNHLTGFCSLEHAWILPLRDHLAEHRYDCLLDGIGGDVLSASAFLTRERLDLYRAGDLDSLAQDILGGEGRLPKLLRSEAYGRLGRDTAVARLVQELDRHRGSPNPIGQFVFWNRTRRHIALSGWKLLGERTPILAPFLDEDLYRFLTSLPAEYSIGKGFHERTIAKRYPDFANMAYADGSRGPIRRTLLGNAAQSAEIAGYFLRRQPGGSMYRSSYLAPRLLKGLLSPKFLGEFLGMYRLPVYLDELLRVREAHCKGPSDRPASDSPGAKSNH
jgi:hypothetical protein